MSQLHPVFNVVKLMPAPSDPIPGCHPQPPLPPEIVNSEEKWIVEEILDSKMVNWKLWYLVKCEGFGIEHNSWEPWNDVHASKLITEFIRNTLALPAKSELSNSTLSLSGPFHL